MSKANIQYEILEGLINSLTKRIDKLDSQIRDIGTERDFLYKLYKEFNTTIKILSVDSKKLYEAFLGEIEEQGLSIEEVRDILKNKIKSRG